MRNTVIKEGMAQALSYPLARALDVRFCLYNYFTLTFSTILLPCRHETTIHARARSLERSEMREGCEA
jgi:hypothetical protein